MSCRWNTSFLLRPLFLKVVLGVTAERRLARSFGRRPFCRALKRTLVRMAETAVTAVFARAGEPPRSMASMLGNPARANACNNESKRLVTFPREGAHPKVGVIVRDRVVAFRHLRKRSRDLFLS